eukprot:jgi/Botrbrau1/4297/Bobra.0390s0036.1
MLYQLGITVLLLCGVYIVLKRVAGLVISRVAHNKHFRLTVASVGLGLVSNIDLKLSTGLVARVRVREVSVARSNSARKLVQGIQRAAQTQRFRIPITIRDVEIVLREQASPAPATQAPADAPAGLRSPGSPFQSRTPAPPGPRHQQCRAGHGRRAGTSGNPPAEGDIERGGKRKGHVLWGSVVFPMLRWAGSGTLPQGPAGPSAGPSRCHVFDVAEVTCDVVLWLRLPSFGLKCEKAQLGIPERKRAPRSPRGHVPPKPQSHLDIAALVLLLPCELEVKLGTLAVTSEGLETQEGTLDVQLECGGLTVWASRVPQPSRSIPEGLMELNSNSELSRLYGISLYLAPLQVTAGLAEKAPGVALMWRGATADVTLSRTRDRAFPFIRKLTHELTFKKRPPAALAASLHVKGTLNVRDISTTLCAESAWQLAAGGVSMWAAHAGPAGPGVLEDTEGALGGPSSLDASKAVPHDSPSAGTAGDFRTVPPTTAPAFVQPLQWEADFEVSEKSRLELQGEAGREVAELTFRRFAGRVSGGTAGPAVPVPSPVGGEARGPSGTPSRPGSREAGSVLSPRTAFRTGCSTPGSRPSSREGGGVRWAAAVGESLPPPAALLDASVEGVDLRVMVGRSGPTGHPPAPRPGWEVQEDGWCSVLRVASVSASARAASVPGGPPQPAPAGELRLVGLAIAADVALLDALGPQIPVFIPPPRLFPSRARKKRAGNKVPGSLVSPGVPQPLVLCLESVSVTCSGDVILPSVSALPKQAPAERPPPEEGGVRDAPPPCDADSDVPLRYVQTLSISSLTTALDPLAASLDLELEDLFLDCEEHRGEAPMGTAKNLSSPEGSGCLSPPVEPGGTDRDGRILLPDGSLDSCRNVVRRRWNEYSDAALKPNQDASPGPTTSSQSDPSPHEGPKGPAPARNVRIMHIAQVSAVAALPAGLPHQATRLPNQASAPSTPPEPAPRPGVAIEVAVSGVSACFDAASVLGSAAVADRCVAVISEAVCAPAGPGPMGPGPAGAQVTEGTGSGAGGGPAAAAAEPAPLPDVQLALRVSRVDVTAPLAATVEWGVSIEGASAVLGSRSAALEGAALCLNKRRLIYVGAAAIEALALPGDEGKKTEANAGAAAEPLATRSRSLARASSSGADILWPSPGSLGRDTQRTDLVREDSGSAPDLPDTPFGRDPSRLAQAYLRSGFASSHHGPGDVCSSSVLNGGERDRNRGNVGDEPQPGIVLEACLYDCVVSTPYDQDPGTAQRFTELWAKAFKEELLRSLSSALALKKSPGRADKKQRGGFDLATAAIEARVAIKGALFLMEHHPLEAWFAVHGPLLRDFSVQGALWGRSLPLVMPSGPRDPGSSGLTNSGSLDRVSAGGSMSVAAEAVSSALSAAYRLKCNTLQDGEARRTAQGALMHVWAESLEALLVVGGGDAAALQTASAFMAAVDPPTQGVPMTQVRKLHCDIAVREVEVDFSGAARPIASSQHTRISGTVAFGRQASAPPQTEERWIRVTPSRRAQISVALKGTRPLVKAFTDLHVIANDSSSCFGNGLDPVIAVVSLAGRRLSPSEPDTTRPKLATLQWWDTMRQFWRGQIDVVARDFTFTLGSTASPAVGPLAERMEASVEEARARIAYGSHLTASLVGVSSYGYLAAGLEAPAGAMYRLPLVQLPAVQATMSLTWILRSGRDPNQHHLFPVPVPEGADARQAPIDVVAEQETAAVDTVMTGHVGAPGAVAQYEPPGLPPSRSGVPRARSPTGSPGGLSDSGANGITVSIGDHQVAFMKGLVSPPSKSRPPGCVLVPKRALFSLPWMPPARQALISRSSMRRFELSITGVPVDVGPLQPSTLQTRSNGLCVSISNATYIGKMLLNQAVTPRVLPETASAIARKRELNRSTTLQLLTQVEAANVKLQGPRSDADFAVDGNVSFSSNGERGFDTVGSGRSGGGASLNTGDSTSWGDTPILSVAMFRVHEANPAPESSAAHVNVPLPCDPGETRPLKFDIEDCRLYVEKEARDNVYIAISRILSGFRVRLNPPRPKASKPAGAGGSSGKGRGGQDASMFRRTSLTGLKLPGPEVEGGGDLLKLLLSQGTVDEDADMEAEVEGEEARVEEEDSPRLLGRESDPNAADPSGRVREQLREPEGGRTSSLLAGRGADDANGEENGAEDEGESRVTHHVEVKGLQINLVAETIAGRFLLSADSATIIVRHLLDLNRTALTFTVQQMQAHVALTEGDPDAPPEWLDQASGVLSLPADTSSTAPLRRVFRPFSVAMRHSKVLEPPDPTPGGSEQLGGKAQPSPKLGKHGKPLAGEELDLRVPEIGIIMDPAEFQVMVDVISNLGAAPMPAVEVMGAEARLVWEEADDEEVRLARDSYAALRHQLRSLEREVLGLLESEGEWEQEGIDPLTITRRSLPYSLSANSTAEVELLEAASMDLAAAAGDLSREREVGDALRELLASLMANSNPNATAVLSPDQRALAVGKALLKTWANEAAEGAAQALKGARAFLEELRAAARKRQQAALGHAKRFLFHFDGVAWELCNERTPFVRAALSGIFLEQVRSIEGSGSNKLIMKGLEVRDVAQGLSATPGTYAGGILVPWNPDESWANDAMLLVKGKLGVPTRSHAVYDHMEVLLHPLGVHLTDSIATTFWDYFFPKDEAGIKKERSKGTGTKGSRLRATPSTPALASDSDMGPSPRSSPGPLESAMISPPSMPISPTAGEVSRKLVHTRSGSLDTFLTSRLDGQSTRTFPRVAAPTVHNRSVSNDDVDGFQSIMSSSAVGSASSTILENLGSGKEKRRADPAEKKKVGRRKTPKAPPPQRRVLFKHVRLNRVHCRVTYQGYPFNINDLKILLDKRVYEYMDCRWMDLFNRLKWDTIKSVLKSVTGLQGRKFKELIGDNTSGGDAEKKEGAVKTWLQNLVTKKPNAAAGEEDSETAKASAVRRMLLGKQRIPARLGRAEVEQAGPSIARTSEDLSSAPDPAENIYDPSLGQDSQQAGREDEGSVTSPMSPSLLNASSELGTGNIPRPVRRSGLPAFTAQARALFRPGNGSRQATESSEEGVGASAGPNGAGFDESMAEGSELHCAEPGEAGLRAVAGSEQDQILQAAVNEGGGAPRLPAPPPDPSLEEGEGGGEATPPSKGQSWSVQLRGTAEAVGQKFQEWERKWHGENRTADGPAEAGADATTSDIDFAPLGAGLLHREDAPPPYSVPTGTRSGRETPDTTQPFAEAGGVASRRVDGAAGPLSSGHGFGLVAPASGSGRGEPDAAGGWEATAIPQPTHPVLEFEGGPGEPPAPAGARTAWHPFAASAPQHGEEAPLIDLGSPTSPEAWSRVAPEPLGEQTAPAAAPQSVLQSPFGFGVAPPEPVSVVHQRDAAVYSPFTTVLSDIINPEGASSGDAVLMQEPLPPVPAGNRGGSEVAVPPADGDAHSPEGPRGPLPLPTVRASGPGDAHEPSGAERSPASAWAPSPWESARGVGSPMGLRDMSRGSSGALPTLARTSSGASDASTESSRQRRMAEAVRRLSAASARLLVPNPGPPEPASGPPRGAVSEDGSRPLDRPSWGSSHSPATPATPANQPILPGSLSLDNSLKVWKLADLASAEDGTRGALSIEELLAMESQAGPPPPPPAAPGASATSPLAADAPSGTFRKTHPSILGRLKEKTRGGEGSSGGLNRGSGSGLMQRGGSMSLDAALAGKSSGGGTNSRPAPDVSDVAAKLFSKAGNLMKRAKGGGANAGPSNPRPPSDSSEDIQRN